VGAQWEEVPVTTPFDEGHPAIGGTPAWFSTNVKKTPGGDVLILTLRVPNTTVTAVLSKADAETWLQQFAENVGKMSSLVIAPAAYDPSILNGNNPVR
jgi:hypothetical protein